MREVAEFRVDEHYASLLFKDDEGKRLGDSVRKVEIATNDSRFRRIGELQAQLRQSAGKPFFYGWSLTRRYAANELASARMLHLKVVSVFEPPGEECGTKYDEIEGCQRCGAGAKQVGPLFLDEKRIPKTRDFTKTIAGEIVVSRRVVDLFAQHGLTGAGFHPVRTKGAKSLQPSKWSQLVVRSTPVDIVAPTRVANNPFDDDPKNEYRCPEGHLLGLNLLSEVFVSEATLGETDVIASRQFIGVRRGLLRPERIILISPKFWRLIDSEKLKGCKVEVAHVV